LLQMLPRAPLFSKQLIYMHPVSLDKEGALTVQKIKKLDCHERTIIF